MLKIKICKITVAYHKEKLTIKIVIWKTKGWKLIKTNTNAAVEQR